jgi:4-amino-4-deoxy-L-arabinose transferase-like glycosyltransferase
VGLRRRLGRLALIDGDPVTGLMVLAAGSIAAFLFCVVRAGFDLRARRYWWGAAGLAVAALLLWGLLTPLPTHAVKIDLPVNN